MVESMSAPQHMMKAVRFNTPEGHEKPSREHPARIDVVEEPIPEIGPEDVLIKVEFAGINAADTHQRAGAYPPPEGVTEIPGLEVAGTIEKVGAQAGDWEFGTPVCALLAGGGYAEYVVVNSRQVVPVPQNVSMAQAGGLVEVAATVWSNLVMQAGLSAGDHLLVHGGSGGIGQMAIHVGKALGAHVMATCGSAEKVRLVEELGAVGINYREENFVDRVHAITDGHGADVILDVVGGAYVEDDLQALAMYGRVVFIGTQGGAKGTLNVMRLMAKRGWVTGTTLRSRSVDQKEQIMAEVQKHVWPLVADGTIPVAEPEIFDLAETAKAYERFADDDRVGKIVLRVGS